MPTISLACSLLVIRLSGNVVSNCSTPWCKGISHINLRPALSSNALFSPSCCSLPKAPSCIPSNAPPNALHPPFNPSNVASWPSAAFAKCRNELVSAIHLALKNHDVSRDCFPLSSQLSCHLWMLEQNMGVGSLSAAGSVKQVWADSHALLQHLHCRKA